MKARYVFTYAAAVAVVVAACGDGSNGSSVTTSPITTSPVTTSPVTTGVPGSDSDALAGTSWVATAMSGTDGSIAIVPGSEPTITFGPDGSTASGSTGCNLFSGDVVIGAATVRFGQMAVTERGCIPAEIMEMESDFLRILLGVSSFTLGRDELTLSGDAGSVSWEAPEVVDDAALEGTRWQLETVVDGEAATSVIATTRPELVIDPGAGSLRGTTGCNDFEGRVSIEGDRLVVSAMAWSEIRCEQAIMAQEAVILEVVQSAARFEIEGDRLTVFGADGAVVYRAS